MKNEEDEKDENIPKVLCEMDNHLGKLGTGHKYFSGGGGFHEGDYS